MFFLLLFVSVVTGASGQTNLYDRIGIIQEHGSHGAVPEENIDLYTGNLTLRSLDIVLAGPNGLDIKIWRVYNSKLYNDIGIGGGQSQLQQEPYSWVGMGWVLHMGRVHHWDNGDPIIEFPDGRWETAYTNAYGTGYITKDFLKYDKSGQNPKLLFPDGTVWTFGYDAHITYVDRTESVKLVTTIQNSFGQTVTVHYYNQETQQGTPIIDYISDSMGRSITFTTDGNPTYPKLTQITTHDSLGDDAVYDYTVDTFYGGYYRLSAFKPPVLTTSSTFLYNSNKELETVTTCYGGTLIYTYAAHNFFFDGNFHSSRVLSQKDVRFTATGTWETWTYSYPSYQTPPTGTVVVHGPMFDTNVTYNSYDVSAPWKTGLLVEKSFSDGSYKESYDWTSIVISSVDPWVVINKNMGLATAPLIESKTTTRKGDASSKEVYLYERALNRRGLATRINYYGNDPNNFKSYKTLRYFFEDNSSYETKNLLSYVSDERIYGHDNTLIKETQTSYDQRDYYWGAIDWIKRLKKTGSPQEYLTWDYTLSYPNGDTDPIHIQNTIALPGAGTETYEYSYGVLSKVTKPGQDSTYTELERTISRFDSSITDETNQHGEKTEFHYDALGRIQSIVMPGFNTINAVWTLGNPNKVEITQDVSPNQNKVTKYWDGMGRDLGHEESGDATVLYSRRILDAENRVIEESKQSAVSSDTFKYMLNAAGLATKITDPRGKETDILYEGVTKTVTDAESRNTVFQHTGFPGLVSQLTDAQNRNASYTYDDIGRLTQTTYGIPGSLRTQSYSYDGLDNVLTEEHPETGLISYSYSPANNLETKTWSVVTTTYTYFPGNQLHTLDSQDEVITYDYDVRGRVRSVSSSLGWSRSNITYNPLGSVLSETQSTPGLPPMPLGYLYDLNNNLASVTYPDGNVLSATNNGLNMPETLTFGSKNIISAMTYGPGKKPLTMAIEGNGTNFTATYDGAGLLASATLKKGTANTLYAASYAYDNVGNVHAISNTTPNLDSTYGYDELYRLASVTYTPQGVGSSNSINYTYDYFGNLLTATKNPPSQPYAKDYSAKNQVSDFNYDGRGNLTAAEDKLFFWDNQNRLTQVREVSGLVLGDYRYNERGLRIYALPPAPEIIIKQGTTSVQSGESVSFRIPVGSYLDKPFTIENDGDADLVLQGSPFITVTPNDAGFSVLQQPTSPIPGSGGNTTFVIRFQPASAGNKEASISIASNDADKNPYIIHLVGSNPAPEMKVKQGTSEISDGQSVTFLCAVNGNADATLTIENQGDADLALSGSPIVSITGTNANQFSVLQQPTTPVAPTGGTTTFVIRFQPTSDGNKTASIAIANNDADKNPYDIILNGVIAHPEINIPQAPDGGSWEFPSVALGDMWVDTFTIQNLGDTTLQLTGNPIIRKSGRDPASFSVEQQPSSTIAPGGTTTFRIAFRPARRGFLTATISINNNDANENPYDIVLSGYGVIGPQKPQLSITSPKGGEVLPADSEQSIEWEGGEVIKDVKLEYSDDNGGSYLTIVDRTPNTGSFAWRVPIGISPSCLIRISDADGRPIVASPTSSYELRLMISSPSAVANPFSAFRMHIAVPEPEAQRNDSIDMELTVDSLAEQGSFSLNGVLSDPIACGLLLDKWHHVRVLLDPESGTAALWLDNEPVLQNIPVKIGPVSGPSPEISFSADPDSSGMAWIDDFEVKILDPDLKAKGLDPASHLAWQRLWLDGFENYGEGGFPLQGGWTAAPLLEGAAGTGDNRVEAEPLRGTSGLKKSMFTVDGSESATGLQSLRGSRPVDAETRIVKAFALPQIAPFDVSDAPFSIVGGNSADEGKANTLKQARRAGLGSVSAIGDPVALRLLRRERASAGGPQNSTPSEPQPNDPKTETLTVRSNGTYYIYSFDGKLMAEYDAAGQRIRDYIYMGNQLVAEYRGGTTYYYYLTDQVNSTRMVTDDSGTAVYSVAYEPFGCVEKEWIPNPTYTPALKYSGKERDEESQLDYFGARYFANAGYRWISVDPVINKTEALGNPQLWNLYAFCRNNPVTFFDRYGADVIYRDPKLQTIIESMDSKMISATLELYKGKGAPDLIIEYGDAGSEKDLGNFNAAPKVEYDWESIPPGTVGEALKDLGRWSIKRGTITIDSSLYKKTRVTKDVIRHELGHADQAARRTREYFRQEEQDRNLLHDERRVEKYADEYAKKSKKW